MLSLAAKKARELKTIKKILTIYCHGKHHTASGLCPACQELQDYAEQRILHCPHMETKTFCSVCPTHCYTPARREEIRKVMRYSGPRMLLYAPVLALQHMLLQWTAGHSSEK